MRDFYGSKDKADAITDLWGAAAGALEPGASQPGIDAGLFSAIVKEQGVPPNHRCRVVGNTDWSDVRFPRKVSVRGIRFDGDFEADAVAAASVEFAECVFTGRLRLRNCRIGGALRLIGCSFPANPNAAAGPRLVLGGTRIAGELVLRDVEVEGRCSLAGISVRGDLRIARLRARSGGDDACLNLDNARIKGRILIDAGSAGAGNSHIAGSASADGASCHSLEATGLVVEGSFVLPGLQVETGVAFSGLAVHGDLLLYHFQCGHVLRLEGCAVHGQLNLDGARIAAQLDIKAGTFDEIHINGAAVGSLWIGSKGDVLCRSIYVINSVFESYVKMARLTVARRPFAALPAVAAGAASETPAHRLGIVEFEHCRFGSLVTTWPVVRHDGDDGWQQGSGVTVDLGFAFTDCNVNGQLNLTRLVAEDRDSGFVRLDRTTLRGALLISSPLAIARRAQIPPEVRKRARDLVESGDAGRFRARMRSLSMRELEASAVELSGLELLKSGGGDDRLDGTLEAVRVRITGRFETYVVEARGNPPQARRAHARIDGALRLRGASIGELHLDGSSFRERTGCTASTSGVVLELAEIGLLRVPRVEDAHGRGVSAFPVPLDLSGVTIRHWNFEEDVDADTRASADDFLDFLDNDENIHREVYRSVAQSLRNAGSDEDAERILYAEEYRARWESRQRQLGKRDSWPVTGRRNKLEGRSLPTPKLPRLRRAFDWIDRVLLIYRRNPSNLAYAILGLFLFSTLFIANHPSNFEVSQPARLILQQQRGSAVGLAAGLDYDIRIGEMRENRTHRLNAQPEEVEWGFWRTVWTATRYHVPIVDLVGREEFVASNDSELEIGKFGLTVRATWLTAEDWFGLMAILNWVMWPLLLTFAVRRALRAE